jgi:hypothetical protein
MRALNLQTGDRAVVNLTGGDAISGEVRLVDKNGTVYLGKATLHSPNRPQQPLDGGIQIPTTSILWVQVV